MRTALLKKGAKNGAVSFQILEGLEAIERYRAAWDHLFDDGAFEPSASIEWTQALLKSHLTGYTISLIVLRDLDDIVGIVPLYLKTIRKFGLSLSTLFPVSEHFNTHSDLLLKNPSEELLEIFIKALFNLKARWDVFRINRLVETHSLLDHMASHPSDGFHCRFEIRKHEPSFYIQLETSYDDFLKKRSSNFRYKLKSVSKKLPSMGDTRFLKNPDIDSFDEIFDMIRFVEEKSWKHENGTGITCNDKQSTFYRELFKNALKKGWLRFCFLCLNQEPIAYEIGLVNKNKYYGVHGSYDERFKQWNPGTILLAQFINDLIRDRIEEYDWFGEPFEWERRWTDKFRWHKSLLIYNNTPKAALFRLFNRIRTKINPHKNDRLILRNPRNIKPEQS